MNINGTSVLSGLKTIHSAVKTQFQKMTSFLLKLTGVRNSEVKLNSGKSHFYCDLEPLVQSDNKPSPRSELAAKLNMALKDFGQNPEQARAKWIGGQDGINKPADAPEQRQLSRSELAAKLKLALKDFEQNPDMARAKWLKGPASVSHPIK